MLRNQYGYNATYWKRIVAEHGALQAARLLLRAPDAQAGLMKLWELGRLDMSLEQAVFLARFKPLFTEDERQIARKRLRGLGYEPQL